MEIGIPSGDVLIFLTLPSGETSINVEVCSSDLK